MSGLTFALALFVATAPAEEPAPKPIQVVLTGRVVDDDGRPLAGASLKLWNNPPYDRSGVFPAPRVHAPDSGSDSASRADGSFTVRASGSKEAQFGVWISAVGRLPQFSDWVRVDKVKPGVFGSIVLSRPRVVEGRVVDRAGSPVGDAEVFHVGDAPGRPTTRTDAGGRFRLAGMTPGKTIVFVRKAGFRFGGAVVPPKHNPTITLVRRTEAGRPLKTLPWLLTPKEELELCRRLYEKDWNAAKARKDADYLSAISWNGMRGDPWRFHDEYPEMNHYFSAAKLFQSEPEAAFAAFEALSYPSSTKTLLYSRLCNRTPNVDSATRLVMLDRAVRHARNIATPEQKCDGLAGVASALFRIGQYDQGRRLLEEMKPLAASITDEDSRGRYAAALGNIDPLQAEAVLLRLRTGSEVWHRYQFQLAFGVADRNPLLADCLESLIEWSTWIQGWGQSFNDMKAVALCLRMAPGHPNHAISMARRRGDPNIRAYAMGAVANVIAASDRNRAAALLDEAFAILQRQNAVTPSDSMRWLDTSESETAGALLNFVDGVSPEFLEERLWDSLSLREVRRSDRPLTFAPETGDCRLAILVSRYDRELARLLVDRPRTRLCRAACSWNAGFAAACLDPSSIFKMIEAIPADDDSAYGPRMEAKSSFIRALGHSQSSRWDCMKGYLNFWTPDPEAADAFNLVW